MGGRKVLSMSPKDPQSVPKHFLDRFEKIEKVDFFTFFHRYLTFLGNLTFLEKYNFSEKIDVRFIRGVSRFWGGGNLRAASSGKNNDPARSLLICRGFFFNRHLGGVFDISGHHGVVSFTCTITRSTKPGIHH